MSVGFCYLGTFFLGTLFGVGLVFWFIIRGLKIRRK